MADWKLHLGDCLDPATGLASLPDKSVDHVICDPPYDERTHTRARSLKDGGSDIPIDFDPLGSMEHVHQALRVAKRWIICFCAVEQLGEYKRAAGEDLWTRAGIWHRTDGTPQLSADRPAQAAEGIAIIHAAGRKRAWNSGGNRGLWSFGVERDSRVHPTQKPIALMERLVRDFTDSGETILDPFAGSGTTGVAAVRLGRHFIGWEKDPGYHREARRRLEGTREQLGLFVPRARKTKQGSLL